MYKRFKWDETIRYISDWDMPLYHIPHSRWSALECNEAKVKPVRVFVGSTMELFGDWISQPILSDIFHKVRHARQHTFIFLTKQPQNLQKWSPFPDNCWIGVSLDLKKDKYKQHLLSPFETIDHLQLIDAKVKFLSFEPLSDSLCIGFHPRWWADEFYRAGINWLILGQQTPAKKSTTPKAEWIQEIVGTADKATVPVFLKDNLKSLIFSDGIKYKALDWALDNHCYLRQELPHV
jgi:protein gp37